MKVSDLREKSESELNAELLTQLENQFRMRIKRASGQFNQTHEMKATRRTIARIKTVLEQKSGNQNG